MPSQEIAKCVETLAFACDEVTNVQQENKRPVFCKFTSVILECAICSEIYRNPKELPTCGHVFCENCLEALAKDHASGQSIPCPLCRSNWVLTAEKAKALQKSSNVDRMIFACKTASAKTVCTLSAMSSEGAEKLPESEFFCVECDDRLCPDCVYTHQKDRQSTNHTIYLLKDMEQLQEFKQPEWTVECSRHPGHVAMSYCEDCFKCCCWTCLKVTHDNHRHVFINEMAATLRQKLEPEPYKSYKRMIDLQSMVKRLDSTEDGLSTQFENAEEEVRAQAQKLKDYADKWAQECLDELKKTAQKLREEQDYQRTEVDCRLRLATNMCQMLKSDDAEEFKDTELFNLWNYQEIRQSVIGEYDWEFKLETPIVKFDGVSYHGNTMLSSFGSISVTKSALPIPYRPIPEMSYCLPPTGLTGEVTGLTILRRKLYVSYLGSTDLRVSWLDSDGNDLLSPLKIRNCCAVKDIASVAGTDPSMPDTVCIVEPNKVVVIDTIGRKLTNSLDRNFLKLTGSLGNISTTRNGNLLLSFASDQRVVEVTRTGNHVWTTFLDARTVKYRQRGSQCMTPSLAIQMGVDRILVSDQIESRLCILGKYGELIHEYNMLNRRTAPDALGIPRHMTIDRNNNVLVLETRSNPRGWQVLLLSPKLEFLGVLVRSCEDDASEPTKICLDSETGKLYFGLKSGRVSSYLVMDTTSGCNFELDD